MSTDIRDRFHNSLPYELIGTDTRYPEPQDGIALCLSGGGYRAALFHLGAIWFLNEAGMLPNLDRITSVSGGAITAARLGLVWKDLQFDPKTQVASNFHELVAKPILRFTRTTVDLPGSLAMRFSLRYIFNPYRFALDRILLKGASLQDLPQEPRFVFNATNVQSGAVWRFMKPRMRDWRVGDVPEPKTRLSFAVMASSAYPPFLSPMIMRMDHRRFSPESGSDLGLKQFRKKVYLTDGGVHDNLGIETSWKKFGTILVSDAGWPADPDPKPRTLMLGHTMRAVALMNSGFIEIRKRQMIESFKIMHAADQDAAHEIDPHQRVFGRRGAYWGIRNMKAYKADFIDVDLDHKTIERASNTGTRLGSIPRKRQRQLVDLGYLHAAISITKYVTPSLGSIRDLPFNEIARQSSN
ncbi:hypothetical protein AWH62_12195 [Maricaulis sp. W15]|uniref:NTE family protein n=1 Tax=Maricaulis maris TaxID=74318 RepID=A0A495CVV4_9PROT|nr:MULTISPECIES: patatin-like phospholipase family protein [Maricaulis]OLF71889.1 hypothetical protein AWH62_12195 [Maricaulis sp. W15]RKQ89497.1 NTE family protein [Maricaulis maris]